MHRVVAMSFSAVFALVVAAQAADPLSVLRSDAPRAEKIEACRVLAQQAGPEAVPVLAPLLLDANLSHMARYALEPMPHPEAGEALRDALGKTSGPLKAGIVSSLAARKDAQAVPALAVLLLDPDAVVAQAAAKALGDIGLPDAATALGASLDQGLPEGTRMVVHDALLACAETFSALDAPKEAAAIYNRLLALSEARDHLRAAALRGVVVTSPNAQVLQDALRGDDEVLFGAALRVVREIPGTQATAALAEVLPVVPDAKKIRLLAVFASGDAAGPAVLAAAETGSTAVRVAAIQAMTRMGYDPALGLLEQLASSEDADVAKAARDSLSYFPENKGDAAILAMLQSAKPQARRASVELIGQGALERPVDPLMAAALGDADEGVRVAALTALQGYAGLEELPPLLDHLIASDEPEEREATRAVLAAITERQKRMPGGIVIDKAVYGDLPDGASADVTEQVRGLFESGAVTIEASNAHFRDAAPNIVKTLRVDYTENGMPLSKTAREGETLKLPVGSAPPAVVDAFWDAMHAAEGDAKLVLIRLLGATGSQKAFDAVHGAYASSDPKLKAEALRTLCDWPTPVALPTLVQFATGSDTAPKLPALRGAVRLLSSGQADPAQRIPDLAVLMAGARTAEEKMVVLSGLAQQDDTGALDLALAQFADPAVKDEAVQTAINIARNLGKNAAEDPSFFNGTDLAGWTGNTAYWSVRDGAIVGHSAAEIPQNEFLWSAVEVGDFYLVLDVRLEPNRGNAGVQFRSRPMDEQGQAQGYQADVGEGYWGRLYHEHGRGMLDNTDAAEKAVKPGEWNRYEVLTVGPAIWTAINGTLGTACLDLHEDAERTGKIALQMHSGPPMTVQYRIVKLVHNPKVALEHQKVEDLITKLHIPEK
jgi:HEAT repeat protein